MKDTHPRAAMVFIEWMRNRADEKSAIFLPIKKYPD